jgi:hypothetical protein
MEVFPSKASKRISKYSLSFLTPVHVVVEVGAAQVHCFEMERSWVEPDGACVSIWRLDISRPVDSGRRNLGWTTRRRWKGHHVVFEEHIEREGLHLVSPRQPNENR